MSVSDRVFICINRSTEPDYTGLTDIGLDQVSAISVKLVNSVKLVTMDYDGPFFEMYKFMKKKKNSADRAFSRSGYIITAKQNCLSGRTAGMPTHLVRRTKV